MSRPEIRAKKVEHQVSCRVDENQFGQILGYALVHGVSVGEVVRRLIARGLQEWQRASACED